MKANKTAEKLAILDFYKFKYGLSLSPHLVEAMDVLNLEMAFRMMRFEQVMDSAATKIQSVYKAVKTRRMFSALIERRRSGMFIFAVRIKLKVMRRRKEKERQQAAQMIQKFCKGYLVAKRFLKIKGDIAIDKSLSHFRRMKEKIGRQLARSLTYVWRLYKAKKQRLAAEAEAAKKRAKLA